MRPCRETSDRLPTYPIVTLYVFKVQIDFAAATPKLQLWGEYGSDRVTKLHWLVCAFSIYDHRRAKKSHGCRTRARTTMARFREPSLHVVWCRSVGPGQPVAVSVVTHLLLLQGNYRVCCVGRHSPHRDHTRDPMFDRRPRPQYAVCTAE